VSVDTGAFYARIDAGDECHDEATRLFMPIRTGDVAYRPVYTSQAVLSELATLALYKLGHDTATTALSGIRASDSINVIPVREPAFEAAVEQFETYDDQQISFVDHTTGILAAERDVQHVFAFDSDFRTLGFSLAPADVSLSGE